MQRPQVRRWILAGLLVYAVAGLAAYVQDAEDFGGYVLVGNLVLEHRDIYADLPPCINTWPPFFSLLCVPLALLSNASPLLSRGFWTVLNYGGFLIAMHLVARLLYGRALSLRAETGPGRLSLAAPELLVPAFLTYYYLTSNFEHLQINVLLFALTLSGLFLQATGRERAGGLAIGLGTAIKVMPVLFIPYLLYRRRLRAGAWAAGTAAAFSLTPALVFGWNRFLGYASAWKGALEQGWGVGFMNQSVFALWDRFLGHGMLPFTTPGAVFVPRSGMLVVTVAWLLSLAAVAVLGLVLFRGTIRPDSDEAVAEWSVVFLVAALFGTVAWKAYLVVFLLPNALLFKHGFSLDADRGTRRTIGLILVSSFLLGGPTSKEVVGRHLSCVLQMTSCITFAGWILLGGLFWLRGRLGGREPGTF
jgi:hypothetical protein